MTQQDPLRKLYGKRFDKGDLIFREGDRGEKFYLIQSGKVRIVKNHGTPQEVSLTTFSKGEFFGEMALFDMETRSATALADEPCEVYELGQKNFEGFITQRPRVAYEVIQKLCNRIRHMNDMTSTMRKDTASGEVPAATPAAAAPAAQAAPGHDAAEPFRSLAALFLMVLSSIGGRGDGDGVRAEVAVDPKKAARLFSVDPGEVEELFARLSAATQVNSTTPAPELPQEVAETILGTTRLDLVLAESKES